MNSCLNLIIGLTICTTLLACSKKDEPTPSAAIAPTITSFTPTNAAEGATVTITGTDFTGATAVSFGGTVATSFTVVSATSITAVVGTGTSGNVIVTTGSGTASIPGFTFTVTPPVQKGLVIHHANTNQCYGKAITTDVNDNIIAAELFQTNINGKSFTSAGTIDGLFSKYDKNGNLIWDKTAGGANCITTPHGVETDATGNVFVTGYFGQTANTTGRTISFDTKTITSKSDYDVFLAKYNSTGSIQWALALGNPTGVTEERAWDIAVDASGNSYICGAFAGTVDFNPLGTTPRTVSAAGTTNSLFLAKFDANGINLWAIKVDANLGAVLTEAYSSVDLDNAGNVILGGNYRNSITIGANNFTAVGNADIFIASFSQSNGTNNWAKTFGGAGNDILSPGAMRVNAANEPHFTGRFAGTSNMGGTPISSTSGATTNMYLVGLNNTGTTKLALCVPSNSGQSGGHRVGFDIAGNVYITGWYSGTGSLNGINMQAKSGSNAADVALCKLSSTGTLQWFNTFGSAGFTGELNISAGLQVDSENNLLITGKFYGQNIDWDPSPTMTLILSSAGQDDGFVAKYKSDGSLFQKP
jgi:hypothetical protein